MDHCRIWVLVAVVGLGKAWLGGQNIGCELVISVIVVAREIAVVGWLATDLDSTR